MASGLGGRQHLRHPDLGGPWQHMGAPPVRCEESDRLLGVERARTRQKWRPKWRQRECLSLVSASVIPPGDGRLFGRERRACGGEGRGGRLSVSAHPARRVRGGTAAVRIARKQA